MADIQTYFYPALQTLLRLTVRRADGQEFRFQKRMRKADLETLQLYSHRQAVAYVNQMAAESAAYRRKLDQADIRLPIDESPETWQRLPFMTKAEIRCDPEAWYSKHMVRSRVSWTYTSGSTGQPFEAPLDEEAARGERIAKELGLSAVGWRPGWKEAMIKRKEPSLKGMRKILRSLMGNVPITFASRSLNPENAPDVILKLNSERVKFVAGYPSAFCLLSETIFRHKLECRIPVLWAFGEQLSPASIRRIEAAFHGKLYRDYGASECMHVAFECREQNGYHIDLSQYKIEILDGDRPVKPGENGEIVITYFRNHALPLIRYRIGDIATLGDPNDRCPCGIPYPRISQILGRVVEVIHTPSGQKISEFFFDNFSDILNDASSVISRYRVIQKQNELLEIEWVPASGSSREQIPAIEQKILDRAGGAIHLQWKEVQDIPPDPSGKRRRFIPLSAQHT